MTHDPRSRRIQATRDAHKLALMLRDAIEGYKRQNRDVRTGHFTFTVTEEVMEPLHQFIAATDPNPDPLRQIADALFRP